MEDVNMDESGGQETPTLPAPHQVVLDNANIKKMIEQGLPLYSTDDISKLNANVITGTVSLDPSIILNENGQIMQSGLQEFSKLILGQSTPISTDSNVHKDFIFQNQLDAAYYLQLQQRVLEAKIESTKSRNLLLNHMRITSIESTIQQNEENKVFDKFMQQEENENETLIYGKVEGDDEVGGEKKPEEVTLFQFDEETTINGIVHHFVEAANSRIVQKMDEAGHEAPTTLSFTKILSQSLLKTERYYLGVIQEHLSRHVTLKPVLSPQLLSVTEEGVHHLLIGEYYIRLVRHFNQKTPLRVRISAVEESIVRAALQPHKYILKESKQQIDGTEEFSFKQKHYKAVHKYINTVNIQEKIASFNKESKLRRQNDLKIVFHVLGTVHKIHKMRLKIQDLPTKDNPVLLHLYLLKQHVTTSKPFVWDDTQWVESSESSGSGEGTVGDEES